MTTKTLRPQAGPQTQFLRSKADIAIMGGAAGVGKTWCLLIEPLRHMKNPKFGSVIFRRTTTQVTQEGGLWDESQEIYPGLKAQSNRNELKWTFPTGMHVGFAHLEHEKTKQNWDGAQIALLQFDQLEHFSESVFFYMLIRNRSMCGVDPYVRASCNPDPDSWLARFLEWWIDQETGFPISSRSGVLRWFVRISGRLVWASSKAELMNAYPDQAPKSVTFIPGTVYDNRILLAKNPQYLANLKAQGPVELARFLEGNWKARAEAGKIYNRSWFEIVDAVPGGGEVCRFWDFAATKKELKKKDPDWTASVRERVVGGVYYVEDVWAEQVGPAEGEDAFINITLQDIALAKITGATYKVRWEEEPGSASKRESMRLVRILTAKLPKGFFLDAAGVPSRGDKYERGKPLASNARVGNVKLQRGAWNEEWLKHMHNQPDESHDDIHDASTGAFNELSGMVEEVVKTATAQSQVVLAEDIFG